ncbi:hypothetical protein ABKV19_022642 [Rosa sericea]
MAGSQARTITTQSTVYLPNILLDESNYPTWLFRLESFLRGQNLYGYVDGSTSCPAQYVDNNVASPEYVNWKIQDQSIVNMIGQTLSPVAMSCAVGSKSAQEMWSRLKLKFAAPNRQNILQLKTNLQNLKKGNDDIEGYMDKIKAARDALETVGVFIDDEDVVVTVLRGLPSEYAAIKTVIRAQFVSCSIGELKTLLKAAEIDIEVENQSASNITLTAMVAKGQSEASTSSNNSSIATAESNFTSQASTSLTPPGFPPGFPSTPNTQASYVPISAIPYGYSHFNSFPMQDPSTAMTGFYAGRPSFGNQNTRFNNNFGNFRNNSQFGNGGNRNGNFNNQFTPGPVTNSFFRPNGNNTGNNNLVCQLCGKNGHGAKTCRTLSNFQGFQGNINIGNCQYCNKPNHTADRCYYLVGFPGQQQSNHPQVQVNQNLPPQGTAMLAATNTSPQFWLADTGATNHMTNEVQLLHNVAPYNASDTVQVGNGQSAGSGAIQGTE